jgi:DNA-binding MarR family transcriptional regulator
LLATTTIVEKAIRAHLKANCESTLPRFDVLAAMERTEGKLTMSQLSNRLLVSNGNVTGVVNRLVEDGYVRREADPSDRRTQFVSLTAAGRQSFRRMAEQHEELVDDIFSDVSDEDMALLLALTTKVSHLVHSKLKPWSEAAAGSDDDRDRT